MGGSRQGISKEGQDINQLIDQGTTSAFEMSKGHIRARPTADMSRLTH